MPGEGLGELRADVPVRVQPEARHERGREVRLERADGHMALGRRIHPVVGQGPAQGAARARHAVPVGQGQGVRRIGERHRGMPAVPVRAAGPQQGQRGGDGPLGTVQIRREDPRWSPRRQQARRGLVVDVMAWHVRAVPVVSGDVHLADPPVAGADGVGVQAQPAQRPGAVGGEEHVRLGQDLLHLGSPGLGLHVHGAHRLPAVQLLVEGRHQGGHGVPAGREHRDDVGAQLLQAGRGDGPGQVQRDGHHAHPGQRCGAHRPGPSPRSASCRRVPPGRNRSP